MYSTNYQHGPGTWTATHINGAEVQITLALETPNGISRFCLSLESATELHQVLGYALEDYERQQEETRNIAEQSK